ncbi:Abi family protein [Emcibacter sp.]|uniref:Abi family protein n=1 Tax=Emcibacter sp. TaxID=1979954 RepID=UPI002AA8F585|nr:Abi family protein [Emcibacter sp.]
MKFEKPPFSPDQHIALLQNRDLKIDDKEKAKYYLHNIGYYRLSAYFIPFRKTEPVDIEHQFKEDITFQNILDLYIFDRQLRLILYDALERIEVAVRTQITNCLSLNHGTHWFENSSLFNSPLDHAQIIVKFARDVGHNNGGRQSSEAIRHYYKKYKEPQLPPTWMVMEELSIGTLSRLFKFLKNEEKKDIANHFSVSCDVLENWLHSLTVLRNTCAHHSRTWNRTFPSVKIPRKGPNLGIVRENKLQGQICVMKHMMNLIAGDTSWHDRLIAHIKTCPIPYEKDMGFIKQNKP